MLSFFCEFVWYEIPNSHLLLAQLLLVLVLTTLLLLLLLCSRDIFFSLHLPFLCIFDWSMCNTHLSLMLV